MMDWTLIAQQLFAVSRCRRENPPFKTHKILQRRRKYIYIKVPRITLMLLSGPVFYITDELYIHQQVVMQLQAES